MPRLTDRSVNVVPDQATAMATAELCYGGFLDDMVDWLTAPLAHERDKRAVKRGTAGAVRGDVARWLTRRFCGRAS